MPHLRSKVRLCKGCSPFIVISGSATQQACKLEAVSICYYSCLSINPISLTLFIASFYSPNNNTGPPLRLHYAFSFPLCDSFGLYKLFMSLFLTLSQPPFYSYPQPMPNTSADVAGLFQISEDFRSENKRAVATLMLEDVTGSHITIAKATMFKL